MPYEPTIEDGMWTIHASPIPKTFFDTRAILLNKITLFDPALKSKIDYKTAFDQLVQAVDDYNEQAKKAHLHDFILKDNVIHDFLDAYFKTYCYEKTNPFLQALTFVFYPFTIAYREIKRAFFGSSKPSAIYQIEIDYQEEKAVFIGQSTEHQTLKQSQDILISKLNQAISIEQLYDCSEANELSVTSLSIMKALKTYEGNYYNKFFTTATDNDNIKKASELYKIASNRYMLETIKIKKTREILSTVNERDSLRQAVCTSYRA